MNTKFIYRIENNNGKASVLIKNPDRSVSDGPERFDADQSFEELYHQLAK